jgi:ElaB/YqjD/DUF883 family membrane-anchored ribosome-binding protein
MNEPLIDQKTKQDATRLKKAVNTQIEDGINTVSKDLENSTENAVARVNSSMAQFSNEFEKAKGGAIKTAAHATTKFLKNVGNSLSQFFGKTAKVAKKLPGSVGEKVGEYPWVAIPAILLAGFFLRGFLMPSRNHRR